MARGGVNSSNQNRVKGDFKQCGVEYWKKGSIVWSELSGVEDGLTKYECANRMTLPK